MGKCAKQDVLAVIVNKGKIFIGTNNCIIPQLECPRVDMPSGVGYELCKTVCSQINHAEVNACIDAGEYTKGSTLYLFGHTYCCDSCLSYMEDCGVSNIIIVK